jgi:hypothetical protein
MIATLRLCSLYVGLREEGPERQEWCMRAPVIRRLVERNGTAFTCHIHCHITIKPSQPFVFPSPNEAYAHAGLRAARLALLRLRVREKDLQALLAA